MRKLIALLLWLLVSCTLPFEPEGAVRMNPPPAQYESWWHEVEECTSTTGDFSAVRWWQVPSGSLVIQGHSAAGAYASGDVYITEPYVSDRYVVGHEMMHALGFLHPGTYAPPYPWPFNTC